MDAPDAVTRLAVMDVVPTGDAYRQADMKFSLGYWVWSFLAAPEPVPERFIAAAPALEIWRGWSDDVAGRPVPVGHFIPEEAPEDTARQLLDFLT